MPLPQVENFILLDSHLDKQAVYNAGKLVERL